MYLGAKAEGKHKLVARLPAEQSVRKECTFARKAHLSSVGIEALKRGIRTRGDQHQRKCRVRSYHKGFLLACSMIYFQHGHGLIELRGYSHML